MSTHGRGGVRRAWLGSLADYLIRTLEVPVLLARAWDAELALLQVVRPILLSADPSLPLPLPSAFDEDLTTMWRTQAQDYMDDIVEELHGQGIQATGVSSRGWSAADSILEAARPERVAGIVIATHGRGGLRRLALGSVADKVVRGADVPVLVYRPAGRGARRRRVAAAGRVTRPAGRTTWGRSPRARWAW